MTITTEDCARLRELLWQEDAEKIRANAALIAIAITNLPALLQIAEAYFRAPIGGLHFDWCGPSLAEVVIRAEGDSAALFAQLESGQTVKVVPVVAQRS